MEVQSGLADFEVSAQTMSVKRCMLLPTLIPTLPGKVFFPTPFLAQPEGSRVQTRLGTTIPHLLDVIACDKTCQAFPLHFGIYWKP